MPKEQVETKICKKCLLEKPFSEFSTNSMGKDKKQPRCKECLHAAQKKRRQENWDAARLKYTYGISVQEVLDMLEKQDNKCAICAEEFLERRHTVVDHCHRTGKFRGMLCRKCNVGIGQLRDSSEIVYKAYKYLCHS